MLQQQVRLTLLLQRACLVDADAAVDGEGREDDADHAQHHRRTPEAKPAPELDRDA